LHHQSQRGQQLLCPSHCCGRLSNRPPRSMLHNSSTIVTPPQWKHSVHCSHNRCAVGTVLVFFCLCHFTLRACALTGVDGSNKNCVCQTKGCCARTHGWEHCRNGPRPRSPGQAGKGRRCSRATLASNQTLLACHRPQPTQIQMAKPTRSPNHRSPRTRPRGSPNNKLTNMRACKHISKKQRIHSAIDSAGCHQLRANCSLNNKLTNLHACKHISKKQCIHSAIDSAGCHQLRANCSLNNKLTNLRACKHISKKQCIHSAIDSAGRHQLAKGNCLPHGTVNQSSPWMKLVSDKSKVSSRDHCGSDPVRVQSTLGILPDARQVQSPSQQHPLNRVPPSRRAQNACGFPKCPPRFGEAPMRKLALLPTIFVSAPSMGGRNQTALRHPTHAWATRAKIGQCDRRRKRASAASPKTRPRTHKWQHRQQIHKFARVQAH
jgi:hypothetical protein